jgi:hypothetical protein
VGKGEWHEFKAGRGGADVWSAAMICRFFVNDRRSRIIPQLRVASYSEQTPRFVDLLAGNQAAWGAFTVSLIPGSPDIQDDLQDTRVAPMERILRTEKRKAFRRMKRFIASR